MATVHKVGAFSTTLPDDIIEDDSDIIQFPGLGVSTAIAELLSAAGYTVSTPEHRGESGWDVVAKQGKLEVWLNLTSLDEMTYILQHTRGTFLGFGSYDPAAYAELLRTLTKALTQDQRFADVLWFAEVSEPYGFTDPVVGAPGSERRPAPESWEEWKL